MTTPALKPLAALRERFPGPVILVAGPAAMESGLPAGGGETYLLTADLAVSRFLATAETAVVSVPRTLEGFLADTAICPAIVVFAVPLDELAAASALATVQVYGGPGTQVLGLPPSGNAAYRPTAEGGLELTSVNGRRPAGAGAEAYARTSSLLATVYACEEAEQTAASAISAVLGELRREVVLRGPDRLRWPFAPAPMSLPPTMPNGRPWPRVSVVTPSFQQGRYLEENILSVLRQNYPDVEHIVCDGGSRDETVPVLRRYDAHLASWVSEKDRGQSHALNKGFARATGEIVTWLNSDDMFAPGALAAAVVALVTTGADMVAGVVEIYRDGKLDSRHITSCADGFLPLADLLNLDDCWLRGQFFYQPEVLFTRALWERSGGRVREDLHYSMDYELWLRMAKANASLTVIGTPIALFRKHDEQKTFLTESYEPELRALRDAFAAEHALVVPPPAEVAETKRLKIVFFNDNGFRFGAGIGHRRLVEALQLGGHQVFCWSAKDVISGADPLPPRQLAEQLLAGEPDVVFFGNLHGANLGPEVIALVSERCATVFFMHDYWLITGRCAYMKGCEKYLAGCDASCPTPEEYPALAPDKIYDYWERKERLHLGPSPVHVATNSRAVADIVDGYLVERGTAGRAEVINLPLPVQELTRLDRNTCRDLLGVPRDAFLVLFSAGRIDDPRKGVDLLLEAIRLTAIPNLHLGCLGREESAVQLAVGQNLHCFGYVQDHAAMARIYSAADVYVGPSRDETFGQVFIEAAACGTPSIGFRVGGVPEAILDGWSGALAEEISAPALARELVRIWSEAARTSSLSLLGETLVRGRFAPEKSLNQLHHLLGKILAPRGRRLGRKIQLPLRRPATVEVSRISQGFIRYVSGFDRLEPVVQQGRAMKCCWVYGPRAEFELTVEDGGRYYLVLQYICPLKGQVLSLRTKSRFLGKFPLDCAPGQLRTIEIPIYGAAGTQRIFIYPKCRAHHQAAAPERAAFRLYGIALVPRAE